MMRNNITSYSIVNEQGKTTVAVGDTVTIHQGLLRLTAYSDKESAEYMKDLLTQADEKIDDIKIRLEAIDGDNNS